MESELSANEQLVIDYIGKKVGPIGNITFHGQRTSRKWDLRGQIRGLPIRVTFDDYGPSEAYRYQIWIHNGDTDETLGRGNGDRDLKLALITYQWLEVVNHFGGAGS